MEKTFDGLQSACVEIEEAFCAFGAVLEGTRNKWKWAEAYVSFMGKMDVFREKAGITGHFKVVDGDLKWIRVVQKRIR